MGEAQAGSGERGHSGLWFGKAAGCWEERGVCSGGEGWSGEEGEEGMETGKLGAAGKGTALIGRT